MLRHKFDMIAARNVTTTITAGMRRYGTAHTIHDLQGTVRVPVASFTSHHQTVDPWFSFHTFLERTLKNNPASVRYGMVPA